MIWHHSYVKYCYGLIRLIETIRTLKLTSVLSIMCRSYNFAMWRVSCSAVPIMNSDAHDTKRGQTNFTLKPRFGYYLFEWMETRWRHHDKISLCFITDGICFPSATPAVPVLFSDWPRRHKLCLSSLLIRGLSFLVDVRAGKGQNISCIRDWILSFVRADWLLWLTGG